MFQYGHSTSAHVQDFVSLKRSSDPWTSSDPRQQQAITSHSGPASSPASSGDRAQAASMRAEEVHAQQAVLNQLKEVPVKSMTPSLLVAPLLDHGEGATCNQNVVQTILTEHQSLAVKPQDCQ